MVASIAISLFVGFVLGIVFKHYVLSEATDVCAHVTLEAETVKSLVSSELKDLREQIAKKIA